MTADFEPQVSPGDPQRNPQGNPQEGPREDLDVAAAETQSVYDGPVGDPDPAAAMAELAPEIARWVERAVHGEIYNLLAVDPKTSSLCTIAALTVLGHSPEMLKQHITGALNAGATREEISETIGQMVFYGGMPAAVRAFSIAKETFDQQDPHRQQYSRRQQVQPGTQQEMGPSGAPRAPVARPIPGRGVSGLAAYRPRVGPDLDQPPRQDERSDRR